MRYKNYVWKYNPKRLRISHERNIKEIAVPYERSLVRDYGEKRKIVNGIGEFFGEDCIKDFEELKAVFNEGGVGYLILPKMNPFLAVFRAIELEENPQPDYLTYSFEFWECSNGYRCQDPCGSSYYVIKQGESLWNVSNEVGKSIDELMNLNPSIKRPDDVEEGERVKIK